MVSKALLDVFLHYKDRAFLFVEPGGNAGDYLIYRGAQKLAEYAGIRFTSVDHDALDLTAWPEDAVIYLHGSGGFNPWWSGTPMKVLEQAAAEHSGVLIVGPSTFHNDASFLRNNVVATFERASFEKAFVFARENVSYEVLSELAPSEVTLLHDHDTALNLEADDLGISLGVRPLVFYGIREDKEALKFQQPVPFLFWGDPVEYSTSFETWIALHAAVKRVVTNRLHSSIVSLILGKPTTLLPNSYFKNRAVWEYSLEEQGVEWSLEVPKKAGFYGRFPWLREMLINPNVQRLVNRYYQRNIFQALGIDS